MTAREICHCCGKRRVIALVVSLPVNARGVSYEMWRWCDECASRRLTLVDEERAELREEGGHEKQSKPSRRTAPVMGAHAHAHVVIDSRDTAPKQRAQAVPLSIERDQDDEEADDSGDDQAG